MSAAVGSPIRTLAGVRRVWLVDPDSRTVTNLQSADDSVILSTQDRLDGGDLLPGFTLSLREFFAELDRHG